jgi:glycosyltransferase involved in cell wall biosynthesis
MLRDRARADIRIRFLGRMSPANAFLADLDVFVLPSRSEGMSNALLEAMALGLPCVATDVGSNRSLLQPRVSEPAGIICATTSEGLFSAMNQLAGDANARAVLGRRARQNACDHYTTDAMVNRYDHLYLTIARAGGTRDNSQYAASL